MMMMKNRVLCRLSFLSVRRRFASRSSDSSASDMDIGGVRNAYEVLRVSSTASQDCIREAFRKMAKLTHPDMQSGGGNPNPSSVQFILVLSAYQVSNI